MAEGCIHRVLDAVDHQRIFGLNLLPRVRFVLPEVCVVIVVGLHLLGECCRSQDKEQRD
jgi:hypothetical protein